MIKYVLGIATTHDDVVLIEKQRPDWQKGLFNFVGGKMEPGEHSIFTMIREFKEETGVETKLSDWRFVGSLVREKKADNDFKCYVFFSQSERYTECKTIEDERIIHMPKLAFLNELRYNPEKFLPNIEWLYNITQSRDFHSGKIDHIEVVYG